MVVSMEAHIRLLGSPRFRFGDAVFEPPPTKATALLCYLALKGGWCSRDELLYVFYADTPESAARRNLRQILTTVRRLPYSHGLESEHSRVRWPVAVDVHEFQRAVAGGDVSRAGEVFGGMLLEGFTTLEAPEFQAWLVQQRDELFGLWRELLLEHATGLEPTRAAEWLRGLLRYDSLDEAALQAYLRVSLDGGHVTNALRAYGAFRHNLHGELGVEPSPATEALAAELQDRHGAEVAVSTQRTALVPRLVQAAEPVGLPGAGTAFVGRTREVAAATELLSKQECRLLTILGAGGVGKSRLAWEVARANAVGFPDGCLFVGLDSLTSPDAIPTTLAAALGFDLADQPAPLQQVIDAIGGAGVLIVLDNFEHLLEGARVCSHLLAGCPGLTLLVTSRGRLNLIEEWVLPLGGLTVPAAGDDPHTALEADAVTLFVKRATQVRNDFTLSASEAAAVVEICRLLDGYPLAIEIAATWVRALSCMDIAASLQRGIDLLHRSTRNVPERHKSVRATLEHSWSLLSDEERRALRDLAVFVGGFRADAAETVAGVPVETLADLVDASLLRLSGDGRYDRHPLLYQFTYEKLEERPSLRDEIRERHGRYFLRLLRERSGDLQTHERRAALSLFEQEHPNLVAAWRWAVAAVEVEELAATTWALDTVLTHRPLEGRALLAEAIACLDEREPTHRPALAYLLIQQAHFIYQLHGADAEHDASIERGLTLFRELGDRHGLMRGLFGLAVSRHTKGHSEDARLLLRDGLDLARAHGTPRDISLYLLNLLDIEQELAEPARVTTLFEEAATEFDALGDPISAAKVTFGLGAYLIEHGDPERGEALIEDGLGRIRLVGDRRLEPLGFLAVRAAERGDHREAESLAQEWLALALKSGGRQETINAHLVLGRIADLRGEHRLAGARLAHAWREAVALGELSMAAWAGLGLVRSFLAVGEAEEAATLFAFVRRRDEARRYQETVAVLGEELRSLLSAEALVEASDRGRELTLERVAARLASAWSGP